MPENEEAAQSHIVCYSPMMITSQGVWQGDNPFAFALPVFIMQLSLIVITTRILVFLLKPLRQPRVISEILGGLLLGPSGLGRNKAFANTLFPMRSVSVIETIANLGLLYFLFLIGLEMDLNVIRRSGRKGVMVAIGGMFLPFLVSTFTTFNLRTEITSSIHKGTFILFLGVALSVTSFPVLARILAELKLLNTDLARIAMSAAIVNDMCAWVLLALAIAVTENHRHPFASLWVILSGAGYICFCIYILRPVFIWFMKRTPEEDSVKEIHVGLILTGVMLSGFLTDAMGMHAIFGAFLFGLVIPNGPLAASMIDKLEDFVSGLLLPLYFTISGLRVDVSVITNLRSWLFLLLTIVVACAGKVFGTLVVANMYGMPVREGISLGVLMNAKGLVEMIVVNVGRDHKVIDEQSFAVMVLTTVLVTALIIPVVTKIHRPARRLIPYKRRTLQSSKTDVELRLLACVHSPRNCPTIISLLQASNPSKKSPIFVYALHLVELTGRASSMLIVHNNRKRGRPPVNRTQANSDSIISAFENYELHSDGVSVQPITTISPYSTVHEDICDLAQDKRVVMIILPFHKEQTVDGGMEATNPAFQSMNRHVLANAPCSVGILVDRGLGGTTRVSASKVSHHVGVLFFGGADDREALAYGWRMAEHPGIRLTVVRFVAGTKAGNLSKKEKSWKKQEEKATEEEEEEEERERERKMDDEYIRQFKKKHVNEKSVVLMEKVVNNAVETVGVIRGFGSSHDLCVVGRGDGIESPLTAGMMEWSECRELGPIGDLLASSDFSMSVLVVQQYVGPTSLVETPDGQMGYVNANSPRLSGISYRTLKSVEKLNP